MQVLQSHGGEARTKERGSAYRSQAAPMTLIVPHPPPLSSQGTVLHSGPTHHLQSSLNQARHITPTGHLTPVYSTTSGDEKRLSLHPPLWHLYFSIRYTNKVNMVRKISCTETLQPIVKQKACGQGRAGVAIPDQLPPKGLCSKPATRGGSGKGCAVHLW